MPPEVTVEVPASAEHVHVLRAVVAAVAARAGCSIDDIADMKLAVDEAAGRLLQTFPSARLLTVEIERRDDALELTVATDGAAADPSSDAWPTAETTGLGWHILSALVDVAEPIARGSRPAIHMVRRIETPVG